MPAGLIGSGSCALLSEGYGGEQPGPGGPGRHAMGEYAATHAWVVQRNRLFRRAGTAPAITPNVV